MDKKRALITGANGGIGRKIVETFAAQGCNIYAHMRCQNPEFLTFAKKIEEEYGIQIECIYFDLLKEEEIRENIRKLINEKVTIDILVNNAGVAHGGLLQMTSMNEIRKVFFVNFFSVVQLTQLISRIMGKRGGGSIINMASISGLELAAGNCAYGTSKAAVIAFTKTIAKELAPLNIRVNAVAPGLTNTTMAEKMEEKAGEAMIRETAFKRLAEPQEIADCVAYLASEKSSFITGQVIRVDGGM